MPDAKIMVADLLENFVPEGAEADSGWKKIKTAEKSVVQENTEKKTSGVVAGSKKQA